MSSMERERKGGEHASVIHGGGDDSNDDDDDDDDDDDEKLFAKTNCSILSKSPVSSKGGRGKGKEVAAAASEAATENEVVFDSSRDDEGDLVAV